MNEWIDRASSSLQRFLTHPLYKSGEVSITLADISAFALLIALAFLVGTLVQRWLTHWLLPRTRLDRSTAYAVGRIIGYLVTALILVVLIQSTGVNLSSLALIGGAVGIGIGFGLQNIITNFVSGLIILVERHINVGDRVDLGDLAGVVTRIRARSTDIRTGDNVYVIVPNSEFVSGRVINWSQGSPEVRFRIPFGVAYGTDIEKLKQVVVAAAIATPGVLPQPVPELFFDGFGESSLDFELVVWNTEHVDRPRRFRSNLRFVIERALRENQIEIPFPQRDLHIKSREDSSLA